MNLGMKVRDTVTGFTGIAVAKLEKLKGTTAYSVQSTELFEGRIVEEWFEEGRLEVIQQESLSKAA